MDNANLRHTEHTAASTQALHGKSSKLHKNICLRSSFGSLRMGAMYAMVWNTFASSVKRSLCIKFIEDVDSATILARATSASSIFLLSLAKEPRWEPSSSRALFRVISVGGSAYGDDIGERVKDQVGPMAYSLFAAEFAAIISRHFNSTRKGQLLENLLRIPYCRN